MTTKPMRSTRAAEEVSTLIKAYYARGREKVARGDYVAWCMRGVPDELLLTMDIHPAYPENYGTVCAARQMAVPFIDQAEGDGFSHDICGYLRVGLGYGRRMQQEEAADAPFGGMPQPHMFLAPSRMCDPRSKVFEAMRRYLEVPAYIYDMLCPPVDDADCQDRKAQEHYIEHNVEGMKGLVRFLEKVTGKRLEEDRLAGAVQNSHETWRLLYDVHELRKNVPCPMPSEDAFAIIFPYLWIAGEDASVRFYQNLYHEVKERAEKGVGAVPEERFRILWIGLPPYFDMGIFNYLEGHGAVSVMETTYYPTRPFEVDRVDPLKALMERYFWGYDMGGSDGTQIRCGPVGGSLVMEFVRDYKIDGAIVHCIRSCRAVSIGSKHMAKLLREEMDLPTLYLEADMTDPRDYSPAHVRADIDSFIELLASRKAKRP